MTTEIADDKVSYEQFREEWLAEIEDGNLSPLDKGRLFVTKIIAQWLSVTTDDDDDDGNSEEDDTYYIVQSKSLS